MHVDLGPILYADAPDEENEGEVWCFRVHLLVRGAAEEPPITVRAAEAWATVGEPKLAHSFPTYDPGDGKPAGAYYWSWRVEAERDETKRRWLTYHVESNNDGDSVPGVAGRRFDNVCIPPKGALPNIAFFSCNGESHETAYHGPQHAQRMWDHMQETHEEDQPDFDGEKGAYSLLIGGGDQVYADKLWQREPLKNYKDLSFNQVADAEVEDGFEEAVLGLYIGLYAEHWSKPFMRDVFARVPGTFTWDDHDIRDGWGSQPNEVEESDCYWAVERAASDCFEAFQLGGRQLTAESESGPERGGPLCREAGHYLQHLRFCESRAELDVVMLDIRSGRSRHRVLSGHQWVELKALLAEHRERSDHGRPRHLVLVSSVPLVHYRYYPGDVPMNAQGLNDDLLDQWEHDYHRGERKRLIELLLQHAKAAHCRVTILSGDVHVGARGKVTSSNPRHVPASSLGGGGENRAIIHQLTSSAIGHESPTSFMWAGIKKLTTGDPEPVGEQATSEMMRLSPGKEVIRARNWLSVRFDDPSDSANGEEGVRLWGKWFYEGEVSDKTLDADVLGLGEEAVVPAFASEDT